MAATVKTEPTPSTMSAEDQKEIEELAAKFVEQHRQAIEKLQRGTQIPVRGTLIARGGKLLGAPGGASASSGSELTKPKDDTSALDYSSQQMKFGWTDVNETQIPYILRTGDVKFVAVNIVEKKVLDKFLPKLPASVVTCTSIKSYFVTRNEVKLLNDILTKHCNGSFMPNTSFNEKDLIVRLDDSIEFYRFLETCYRKILDKKHDFQNDRCGFFRINGESIVPYTVKNGVKLVPLFYFEGETDQLKQKAEKVDSWELAYLKFCCKVQGVRNDLFNESGDCDVVSLEDIKGYFPANNKFEEYFPSNPIAHLTTVMERQTTQRSQQQQQALPSPAPQGQISRPPVPPLARFAGSVNDPNLAMQNGLQQHTPKQRHPYSAQQLQSLERQKMLQQQSQLAFQAQPRTTTALASYKAFTQGPNMVVTTANGGVMQIPSSMANLLPETSSLAHRLQMPPVVPTINGVGSLVNFQAMASHGTMKTLSAAAIQQQLYAQQQQLQQAVGQKRPSSMRPSSPEIQVISTNLRSSHHPSSARSSKPPVPNLIPAQASKMAASLWLFCIPDRETDASPDDTGTVDSDNTSATRMAPVDEVVRTLFPTSVVSSFMDACKALEIQIHIASRAETKTLYESGKIQSPNLEVKMVNIQDILRFHPQLKYMCSDGSAAKRPKLS
ncbi:unnamed protein product [Cyprideis torosa]|uniref:Uncharacterized protein n=1 Tax=Cyprideis torosa TaxID=163714 RepID=A0A7R8WEX0_9CRUS|nr:unnamed protein product [Cyprideis torosa]CAG0896151.1 unnamed protein product [Cyprideis torosa]